MLRKTLSLLVPGFFLAALPASADNPATTQWVLATAKATGAGGEQYVSSLRIVNPGTVSATVSLTYLAQSAIDPNTFTASGDNGSATSVSVTVPGGQTLAVEDVLGTKFSSAAPFGVTAGGIKVTSSVPVSVLSRTYVANARSQTGVPGTYGLSMPTQTVDDAVSAGDTAYVSYVAASPSTSIGSRSNFIMVNLAEAQSVLHVKLQKADGTVAGERDYTLARLAAAQQVNIASSFSYPATDENLTLVVTVTSGGPVAVGATVIDNAISSVTYVAPSKVFVPNNGAFGLILDDGGFGFSGRLDIEGGTPTFLTAGIVLEGCPGGSSQLFFIQAFTSGPNRNATFTRNGDGSWALAGTSKASDGSTSATYSGTVYGAVDGSLYGTLTYLRSTGSSGGTCPGISKTMTYQGSRGLVLTTSP